MVNTGFISFITETGGGQDVNGNPVAPVKTPSDFFPCNILIITKQYTVGPEIDGQYRQAKYSIIIDNVKIAGLDLSALTQVILQDSIQVGLGTFQVQNKTKLVLTGQLKIVV